MLHRVENRQAESLQAYEEALRIRRALALEKREAYLPDVAIHAEQPGKPAPAVELPGRLPGV
ncbi:MAG: hypothetical protein IPO75_17195 [Betaproteobacteria bacterium]|nr:hypothetical protein [Betaproteobacteria bacterium]